MHLHFERCINTKCDCSILSLSWMGKVPDDIPEDEGWKLNRTNYYQEGWLATGNIRGIVGVTFSTSHCKKNMEFPLRTNYNLRGHRAEVILVKWNEPYQKLASCDSSGIIFVWIKYEGRWSIELINDRNTPVTHFAWSHDGRMALICYQDGFVLVGSVAGQRYWSSMLNLNATITCGIWTPDDQQVYFATTQGQVIVMDVHGAMVSQVQLCADVGITGMSWSCEKFKMEEGEDIEPGVTNASKRSFVLAVSFQNGYIYLIKSFDDVSPIRIRTDLLGIVMEWSNSRELLAVAGTCQNLSEFLDPPTTPVYENFVKFYTECGTLLYTARIPNSSNPVSALTWGHNDKRIFIATGNHVHIAWVSRKIASLQLLCRLQIQSSLPSEAFLARLPLPSRIKLLIGNLFAQTIRCCVPDAKSLREFVSRPPVCSTRLHCTMIRHDDDSNLSSGTCYTLYLEYLGGLVPLLKGKRTSKIRPEFVIFDPQVENSSIFFSYSPDSKSSSGSSHSTGGGTTTGRSESSDSDLDDGCRGSPRLQRRRKIRSKRKPASAQNGSDKSGQNHESGEGSDELAYVDTLPEDIKLVEVTSNIWGTKFKIHGIAKTVPANLGQVTYKTSLLHLQPRQMTLVITELRDDFPTGPDPTFNPNIFSEDEEEQTLYSPPPVPQSRRLKEGAPPIAPMSPRPNRFTTILKNYSPRGDVPTVGAVGGPALARAESYEEELPYADSSDPPNHLAEGKVSSTATSRPGPSYTNLVTPYSRSSSSSGQSRHAISPLCCEGSVPTLQSPKNAVAPSDIIFDRPPAAQTTLMSYSSSTDYSTNVHQVKSALIAESPRTNSHVNPVPLNLNLNLERLESKSSQQRDSNNCRFGRRKDLQFIDEEATPKNDASAPSTSTIRRTPTVLSIAPAIPDAMTRSCSVGYLDSVDMVPSDSALLMLRRDTPYKRLILVDRKPKKNRKHHDDINKPKLQQSGKSKSLDFCDLQQQIAEQSKKDGKQGDENSGKNTSVKATTVNSFISRTPILNRREKPKMCSICKQISPTVSSLESVCLSCRKSPGQRHESLVNNNITVNNNYSVVGKSKTGATPRRYPHSSGHEGAGNSAVTNNNGLDLRSVNKRTEVITSYTDSPLFSRKHRYKETTSSRRGEEKSPSLERKNNLSRRKKRDDSLRLYENDQVEIMPMEQRTSVSLHTQALTTLESIISRLRDLDEGRFTPASPQHTSKLPKSSPASPAPSKKGKRHQSASPIRHILNSPLLNRRQRKKQPVESSDDELGQGGSGEENSSGGKQYRDLETFQKAQLRQKLKRGKIEPNGTNTSSAYSQPAPLRREFVMHNKAPMWNENSQVYQLDFGGRVTQESAKNFQIEFRGKQVMQFGRIDGNAYTLDFQYPFSALQAFAVALANVTQRLK
ncbi:tubby-related protein 4 isoform X2 [Phlebotomus papatasi]|uniref:tubby-related protein 4 isoform X2 n=1 Tax=Phlebotomus papatasi TaxID=29031 RepID=UPI0024839596|nr:tubby-related protein 4 isoform X2 [Phlebotomus papatasi]XP_055700228.1 tubby-related protein 4 isoform X2 [Phlebotomus papatasi]XP_055700229.1 tubby-related protein 4 isoform X2 [Phlebotomus papatasi]